MDSKTPYLRWLHSTLSSTVCSLTSWVTLLFLMIFNKHVHHIPMKLNTHHLHKFPDVPFQLVPVPPSPEAAFALVFVLSGHLTPFISPSILSKSPSAFTLIWWSCFPPHQVQTSKKNPMVLLLLTMHTSTSFLKDVCPVISVFLSKARPSVLSRIAHEQFLISLFKVKWF